MIPAPHDSAAGSFGRMEVPRHPANVMTHTEDA
jgi:hypothetical protein